MRLSRINTRPTFIPVFLSESSGHCPASWPACSTPSRTIHRSASCSHNILLAPPPARSLPHEDGVKMETCPIHLSHASDTSAVSVENTCCIGAAPAQARYGVLPGSVKCLHGTASRPVFRRGGRVPELPSGGATVTSGPAASQPSHPSI